MFHLKSTPNHSPNPTPQQRRSPTPEPTARFANDHEAARQRSISLSEATPKALPGGGVTRELPNLDLDKTPAASFRTVYQGGLGLAGAPSAAGGEVGSSRAISSPMREGGSNGLTISRTGSQPASGRASPAPSTATRSKQSYAPSVVSVQPGRSHSSSGTVPHTINSLDSFNSKTVAAAFVGTSGEQRQIDDVWQTLCIRLLPLFNGEGLKGYVEDLNKLVLTHIQRTLARCQTTSKTISHATPTTNVSSLATGFLTGDLSDLISVGCLTLTAKLAPAPPAQSLTDEKFLLRLNELWSFFWTGVLPYLEAVFWVLRSDERLKATTTPSVGGARERERSGARISEGTESSRIDARRLALIGFRDHLILPQIERISRLFGDLCDVNSAPSRKPSPPLPAHTPLNRPPPPSPASYPAPPSTSYFPDPAATDPTSRSSTPSQPNPKSSFPPSASTLAANARRRQMVAILASLLTEDERQMEIDALLRTMRVGNAVDKANGGGTGPEKTLFSHHRPILAEKERQVSDDPETEGSNSNPFIATALPPSSPLHILSRPRASTLDSLDEDEAQEGIGSATPVATARKGKRRGFLPLLGRSKSGSDAPAKPPSGLSSPLFPDADFSSSQTPKGSKALGPKRHNSMRTENESDGTTGSEFERETRGQ